MTRWRQIIKDYTMIVKNTAIAGAACAAVFAILFGVNYLGHQPHQQPPVEQFGWAGEEEAAKAWAAIGDQFPEFFIAGQTVSTEDKVVELWREYQAAHGGEHFKANRQVIGDCVAQGARTAICILQGVQAARGPPGAAAIKDAHVPYLYGCGRVFVGGGRLGGDGSVGSWQAKAVEEYGVLPIDATGAPPYSAAIGRKWGNRPGPPQEFVAIGKEHLVKTTARITNYEGARDAICNGYPITVASNQGFQGNNGRARSQDGKLWGVPGSSWAHQMCFIGVDDTVECPAWAGGGKGALYCMNSWGPEAHASIQAYRDNGDAPPGGFWVARNVAERMLKAGDSFAYSDFEGFPEQIDFLLIRENVRINRDLFDDVVAVALVFGLGV